MYRENELPVPHVLHGPESVGIATFLGSPLAGAALLAINERRVGRPDRAWKLLGAGLGITAVLFAISAALPASVPAGAFGGLTVALAMSSRTYAKGWFQKATEERVIGEVRYVSRWAAAGVGLIFMCLVLGVSVGVAALTTHDLAVVELSPTAHIYYEGVTADEARRVGEVLRSEGFINEGHETDVRYERVEGGHAISFVVDEGRASPEVINAFRDLATRLLPTTDPHGRLTVRLCDNTWRMHHDVSVP